MKEDLIDHTGLYKLKYIIDSKKFMIDELGIDFIESEKEEVDLISKTNELLKKIDVLSEFINKEELEIENKEHILLMINIKKKKIRPK